MSGQLEPVNRHDHGMACMLTKFVLKYVIGAGWEFFFHSSAAGQFAEADIAKSLLHMISNDIGQVSWKDGSSLSFIELNNQKQ